MARPGNRKDVRNGTYLRRLRTSLGYVDVTVPRTRASGSPADVIGRRDRPAQLLARAPRGPRVSHPAAARAGLLLRVAALFDKSVRVVVPELGKREDVSNARAKELLGWKPRSLEEMVSAMADSMIEHGVVSAPGTGSR